MTSSTTPSATLAIDIGATKAEVALVSRAGGLTSRRRVEVASDANDLFDRIVVAVRELRQHADVDVCGVGCAGPMTNDGELVSPLNIPQWRDFDLAKRLRQATGLAVAVDGDVRALALAEGVFGSAQGVKNYASLVVSTGIGGAVVLDGRLLNGATGNSGHLGHLTVLPGGAQCSCGAKGCLEAEASGWAIAQRTGRPPAEASLEVREATARYVGQAIGSLAAVLDFTHCFVAGSVALGFGDPFFATATATAREYATMPYANTISITRSGLGADGPLLGAAIVGWERAR